MQKSNKDLFDPLRQWAYTAIYEWVNPFLSGAEGKWRRVVLEEAKRLCLESGLSYSDEEIQETADAVARYVYKANHDTLIFTYRGAGQKKVPPKLAELEKRSSRT